MAQRVIHLADLADPELDGQEVMTDLVIAGIGDTYGVPKKIRLTCIVDKQHACPLNGGSKELELSLGDRRLLNCYAIPDSSLHDALHPPECAAVEILERYTLRIFLALPKIRKLAAKRNDPYGVVDEKGREFRSEPIYFVDSVDPPGTDGFVALASIPYRALAIVQTEPKRQRKVLQVTSLQRLEQPWQTFSLTSDVEAGFRHFQSGQGIEAPQQAGGYPAGRFMKLQVMDPETVDEMLVAFRRNDTLSLDDLVGFLGIGKGTLKMRVMVLRKHRLVRSGRQGYRRTPRLITFLRRLDKDGGKL